jgi:hypothetical protein
MLQSIILSQKPAISTTMTSLPPALLEQLLTELSTLASVYHKPPESFVGKGRFGADEIQRAAIQEQRENAAENPIAASAAAAAANGTPANPNNLENLLDIDFDGAAPASADMGTGTPDRMASPPAAGGLGGPPASNSSIADMMGLFDAPVPTSSPTPPQTSSNMNDLMNGFAGMDMSGTSQPPPATQQLGHTPSAKKESTSAGEDLLGLF